MKTITQKMKSLFAVALMIASATVFMACNDDDDEPMLRTETFNYAFNTGQVGEGTAYSGDHPSNFSASITLSEQANGTTNVTVTLNNTLQGRMYMVHAHDGADPATTPNGTPYNETPNADVLVAMINGNGGTASQTSLSSFSFDQLTETYAGFFVVHDPTQDLSTTDLTTYLTVGAFAR